MSEIDHTDPANTTVKPAFKTFEAWATLIVSILGAVMASGLLDPADPVQAKFLKIIGMVLAIAPVMGLQAGRSYLKATANKVAGDVAIARIEAGSLK